MIERIGNRITIAGIILFLQFNHLVAQQSYLTQGDKHFKKGNYENADTFYELFIKSLKKQVKYSDNFDSAAVWEFSFAERFRSIGIDGSKWYEKTIADYKDCRMRDSKLGYFRIFKETALSYWYLKDTLNASKCFYYAYLERKTDRTVLEFLGECFFSEKKYFEAVAIFDLLNKLYSIEHPLLNKANHFANLEKESNLLAAKTFPYTTSTIFYNMDGLGVYGYNADVNKEVKIWTCDSLEQYFGFEHVSQLNDSIVLLHLKEPQKKYYDDPDSVLLIRHHFDNYKAVNLNTLDSWLYMSRKTIEYNGGGVTWRDFDLEITETYYDLNGNIINQTIDTVVEIRQWNISYRGTQFHKESPHHEYFYFKYETKERNGRQIVSDTSGLWLKEGDKLINIKPYKMTFYGHFPMGYVNPDISRDGQQVLYVKRIKQPWEEWYFRDTSAIHNGSLHLLDLSSNADTMLVNYLVYNPRFSENQKYCAYTKIKLPDYERNLLEIYELSSGRKKELRLSDNFTWYRQNPTHKFISPSD